MACNDVYGLIIICLMVILITLALLEIVIHLIVFCIEKLIEEIRKRKLK